MDTLGSHGPGTKSVGGGSGTIRIGSTPVCGTVGWSITQGLSALKVLLAHRKSRAAVIARKFLESTKTHLFLGPGVFERVLLDTRHVPREKRSVGGPDPELRGAQGGAAEVDE